MKKRDLLLILGLVTCLFSTSFAQEGDDGASATVVDRWQHDVVANPGDPNLMTLDDGAPNPSYYANCRECYQAAVRDYRLRDHTRAKMVASTRREDGDNSGNASEGGR